MASRLELLAENWRVIMSKPENRLLFDKMVATCLFIRASEYLIGFAIIFIKEAQALEFVLMAVLVQLFAAFIVCGIMLYQYFTATTLRISHHIDILLKVMLLNSIVLFVVTAIQMLILGKKPVKMILTDSSKYDILVPIAVEAVALGASALVFFFDGRRSKALQICTKEDFLSETDAQSYLLAANAATAA